MCATERAAQGEAQPCSSPSSGTADPVTTARNGGRAGMREHTDKVAAMVARLGGSTSLRDYGEDHSPVTIRRPHRRPDRALRLPQRTVSSSPAHGQARPPLRRGELSAALAIRRPPMRVGALGPVWAGF